MCRLAEPGRRLGGQAGSRHFGVVGVLEDEGFGGMGLGFVFTDGMIRFGTVGVGVNASAEAGGVGRLVRVGCLGLGDD